MTGDYHDQIRPQAQTGFPPLVSGVVAVHHDIDIIHISPRAVAVVSPTRGSVGFRSRS